MRHVLDLGRSVVVYGLAFWAAFVLGLALAAASDPGTYSASEVVRAELWAYAYGTTFLVLGLIVGAVTHGAVRLAERTGAVASSAAVAGALVGGGLPALAFWMLRQDILIEWAAIIGATLVGTLVGALWVPRRQRPSTVAV